MSGQVKCFEARGSRDDVVDDCAWAIPAKAITKRDKRVCWDIIFAKQPLLSKVEEKKLDFVKVGGGMEPLRTLVGRKKRGNKLVRWPAAASYTPGQPTR